MSFNTMHCWDHLVTSSSVNIVKSFQSNFAPYWLKDQLVECATCNPGLSGHGFESVCAVYIKWIS